MAPRKLVLLFSALVCLYHLQMFFMVCDEVSTYSCIWEKCTAAARVCRYQLKPEKGGRFCFQDLKTKDIGVVTTETHCYIPADLRLRTEAAMNNSLTELAKAGHNAADLFIFKLISGQGENWQHMENLGRLRPKICPSCIVLVGQDPGFYLSVSSYKKVNIDSSPYSTYWKACSLSSGKEEFLFNHLPYLSE